VGVRTSSGACGALGSVQGGSVALPSSRIQARVPAGETSGSHCGERRSGWQSGNWLPDRRTGTTPRRADIFALSAMTSGHHSRVHTETIRPCSVRVRTAIPRSVTDDRIKLEPPAHTWSQSARTPSTAIVPFVRFLPGARDLAAQTPSPDRPRRALLWPDCGQAVSVRIPKPKQRDLRHDQCLLTAVGTLNPKNPSPACSRLVEHVHDDPSGVLPCGAKHLQRLVRRASRILTGVQ
jgi:hypothetical protein